MIDLHAHTFNVAYLPLQGILEARGLKRVPAWLITQLLESWIEYEELAGGGSKFTTRLRRQFYARAAGGADWVSLIAEGDDPLTIFVETVDAAFLEAHASEIATASAELDSVPDASDLTAADARLLEGALERIGPQLGAMSAGTARAGLWELLLKLAHKIHGGLAFLQWIVLLFQKESDIVEALFDTYGNTVRLFVHHMMDLGPHYSPKRCVYPFKDTQLKRVRALSNKYKGRLLPFVAYSPFRSDAVKLVVHWLNRGCAGVKFYPPSGYRPIGNRAADLPDGPDPAVVDKRNIALFRYCAEQGIPIFAHCQPGEFERREGSGCLSHPKGWVDVLKTPGLENLRLCLAHAGGEGWTAPAGKEDADALKKCNEGGFIDGVVQLCTNPNNPNVYAEFGCMETLLGPGGAAARNLATRFRKYVKAHGDRFGHRIVYGSDWHMLAKHSSAARYDDIFRDLLRNDRELAVYTLFFFHRNALEFLNLPGYLTRNAEHISAAQRRYLERIVDGQ